MRHAIINNSRQYKQALEPSPNDFLSSTNVFPVSTGLMPQWPSASGRSTSYNATYKKECVKGLRDASVIESMLLLQRTQTQFPGSTMGGSQSFVTPFSGALMSPSGPYGHLHECGMLCEILFVF